MKSDTFFISSITENIKVIEKFVENAEYRDFLKDVKTQFAVFKAFENIGEAVKGLSKKIRSHYPDIPWKEIAGLRDKLIHGYFGIEPKIVWKTIEEDIPKLKLYISEVKAGLKNEK
ncbi:MAG: DUF86 domain-containing protein [bacterium]